MREGRRAEFAGLIDDAMDVPDPTAEGTFVRSRLDWDSAATPPHAAWRAFYRTLLHRRHAAIVPLLGRIVPGRARYACPDPLALDVRWPLDDGRALVLYARFAGARAAVPAPAPDVVTIFTLDPQDAPGHGVTWRIEPA